MSETPDPATTPVESPAQPAAESSSSDNRYDGWARRASVVSRSRVAALIAGVVLGAVITGGTAAAISEFGGENHRGEGESGAYQEAHEGDGNGAEKPDEHDAADPQDGGGRDEANQIPPPPITPPTPAAPPVVPVPPAVPAPPT